MISAESKAGADPAATAPAATYQPGSAFESCPAATGEPTTARDACPQFPDRVHRCGSPRGGHVNHACTCGYAWSTRPARARGVVVTDQPAAPFPADIEVHP